MAVIGVKSITGITSITNAAGGADVLTFHSNNTTERVRIDSSGRLLLGTTTEGNVNADDLTIANSGEGGITIRTGASSNGNIFFSDATSGAGEYAGIIDYKHSSNVMTFGTNGAERLRITSAGRVGIGTDAPADDPLTLYDADNNVGMYFQCPATGNANNNGFRIGRNQTHAFIWNYVNQPLALATQGQERLTILGNGKVGVGTVNPVGNLEVRDTKANLIVAKDGLTVKGNSDLATQYDMIQLGAGGALASYSTATATADTQLVHNAYRHSGGNWKRRYQDTAMHFRMNSPGNAFRFFNAATGNADTDITWTERARIDANGKLQLGSTTATGYNDFDGIGSLNLSNNSADGTVDYTQGIVFCSNASNEGTWTHAGIVATGSSGYNGNLIFATDGSGARDNAASNLTERLRITSGGQVKVDNELRTNRIVPKNGLVSGASGGVIQVVFAENNTVQTFSFANNSFSPQTVCSCTITPQSSNSKILVICSAGVFVNNETGTNFEWSLHLKRGSTLVGGNTQSSHFLGTNVLCSGLNSIESAVTGNFHYMDSPATTSATTYNLCLQGGESRVYGVGRSKYDAPGTKYNYQNSSGCTITLMEITG